MEFVLTLHSIVRWIIVIVAIVALVRFALVAARRAQASNADRGLMSAFMGLLDTQVLLGIIFIVWAGFTRERIEHAVTMLIAVVVSHIITARSKNLDAPVRARNYLITVIVVLVLVFIGVSLLPGGWTR